MLDVKIEVHVWMATFLTAVHAQNSTLDKPVKVSHSHVHANVGLISCCMKV